MSEKIPYRQIHLDFHTSEKIGGIGAKFDAKEFAKTLKDARVNSINLFGKCHHGMFYYPTAVGTQHPGLNGLNLLGGQIKALREEGIRFTVYTCVGWNEEWALKHPEWLQKDKSGVSGLRAPFERGYYSWNNICINKKAYRQVLKDELTEEYELFKPSGFWIDIVVQRGCVCNDCIEEMKSLGMDPANDADIKRHDRMVEIGFCKEFSQYVKGLAPELEVYFNSFPYEVDLADDIELSSHKKREYYDFLDIESLPSDSWGYSHFPVAVNFLNKYEKEVTMMNGKFHMAWGDFGTIRNKEALEYECFRAIANGAKVCVGDQLHPSGRLDPEVYKRIGEVFASIEKKEPWLVNTKKVSEVAVLAASAVLAGNAFTGDLRDEGAYRVLTEAKIPFDFINYIDDISRYKLIILPDKAVLSPGMAARLNGFTTSGGKILATGTAGLLDGQFALDAIKAEYLGESEYDTRYIRLAEDIFEGIPHIDHALYMKGCKVAMKEGGKALAEIVAPYFNRSYESFCSHRQTPPVPEASGEPAVIASDACIYISSPLFSDYGYNGYKAYKDILVCCINKLLDRQLIRADLPALSEVTLRESSKGVVVHTLSYSISRKCKKLDIIEDAVELVGRRYTIYTGFKPARVEIVPEGKNVDFTYEDGFVTYRLDYQKGHSMVFISK